jgi:hypothetical protein
MNNLEFIASILGSLIWPLSVFLIVLLFREEISAKIQALKKVSGGGIEAELDELSTLSKEAELEAPEFETELQTHEYDQIGTERDLDKIVEDVANVSPIAAISLSWSVVESELMRTVLRLGLADNKRPTTSAIQNMIRLKDGSYIEKETFFVLDKMRLIRDKAVREKIGETSIAMNEAIGFGNLAQNIIIKLKGLERK